MVNNDVDNIIYLNMSTLNVTMWKKQGNFCSIRLINEGFLFFHLISREKKTRGSHEPISLIRSRRFFNWLGMSNFKSCKFPILVSM